MKNKKGITISVMLIAVMLMTLLAGTAIVFGTSSINLANKNKFESTLDVVQENAQLYFETNGEYPLAKENGNELTVNTNTLSEEFKKELLQNGDTINILNVIDLKPMKIPSIELGNIKAAEAKNMSMIEQLKTQNVFLINQETGNIYYMDGIKFKNTRIYSNTK